jgi:uncharacterized membrane protein
MRQLYVRVPRGSGEDVLRLAGDIGAVNTARMDADGDDDWDLVLVHIRNESVDHLLESLEELPDFRATLIPTGVLPFHHPGVGEATPIPDLTPRSPVEVLLQRRLQESNPIVFVSYSVITGVIVWIGLYEEVFYLLTGAMLVAPFAGPAMNAGAATATGDLVLLGHSWRRYLVGVALTILTATALSFLAGMSTPTDLAIDVAYLSTFSLLLPIVAGVAGSLFVLNSEETTTVSGAAVSMLIAAAIAPPAGVAGIAFATGEWLLLAHAGFVLIAQVVGINLTSALVFRYYEMTPDRPAFTDGRSGVFAPVVAVTAVAFGALFVLQVLTGATLQEIDLRRTVVDGVHEALADAEDVDLVDVVVRPAAGSTIEESRAVAVIRVLPAAAGDASGIEDAVRERIRSHGPRDVAWDQVLLDVVILQEVGDG